MPINPDLASASTRVRMALASAESAAELLRARPPRIFQARLDLNRVVADLRRAGAYLRAAVSDTGPAEYVDRLAAWYAAEASKIVRPASAGDVANEVHAAQGLLMAADPFGPSTA